MTIDKQALREAAEKAGSGEWSYEEFNRLELPGGSFVKIDGRDAVYCLKKPVGGVKQSRAVTAFIAAFNPKVALALLDENLQLQREKDAIEAVALAMRDDMRQAREQLEAAERSMAEQSAIVAAAEKLVRCKGRYHSELNYRALAKLFGVNTPDLPPMDGESRTVMMPEPFKMAKSSSCLMYYYADEVDKALAAAGIGVKQQEDSVDSDVGRNQPGMVVAVHIGAGDFVKVKGQVFEVEETDFDDHDVTLWFVGGNALKCAAGCPVEVVSAPVAAGIKVKGE